MIISKTPFRISLFGGSTDYESFYSKYGSLLIGFAMDRYCYIGARYTPLILPYRTKISYSKIETVDDNRDIEHNGVRGVLEYLNMLDDPVEITHISDLPSQTGIGSSSSYVMGLLKTITSDVNPKSLAKAAIKIEREILGEVGGIQDQIWAAYGGFNSINIHRDGDFEVKPLPVSNDFHDEFLFRSFLIYTGRARNSFAISESHTKKSALPAKIKILDTAQKAYDCFLDQNIDEIGRMLKIGWDEKRKISNKISSPHVDKMYEELLSKGMIGGKLLGSGGSGFIFGIAKDYDAIDHIKRDFRDNFIDVGIAHKGSEIIT